jgi:hypothetical protein
MMDNVRFENFQISEEDKNSLRIIQHLLEKDNDKWYLPTLQFTFPGNGKGLETLSKDSRLLNKFFLGECAKKWTDCRDVIDERVIEGVVREKKIKGTELKHSDSALVYNMLFAMSLPQLRQWVEDDEDELAKVQAQNNKEKDMNQKVAFEKWVEMKNRFCGA